VKQVLTIALAIFVFDLHISLLNFVGIILTLGGGTWYAIVDFMEQRSSRCTSKFQQGSTIDAQKNLFWTSA
jgi:hypothetical protein